MIKKLVMGLGTKFTKFFTKEENEDSYIRQIIIKNNFVLTEMSRDNIIATVTVVGTPDIDKVDDICDYILENTELKGIDFRVTNEHGDIKQIALVTKEANNVNKSII